MDLSTIVGIVAAFGLMIMAIMSGSGITIFIDFAALIVVSGGTVGATLVHYPFKEVSRAFGVLKKAFFHKEEKPSDTIDALIRYSNKARKEGILSLQSVIPEIKDPFFIKGVQMAVDGQEPEAMKEMLDREIEYIIERHEEGAEIFVAMGTYAPAMGMIGTLIGLVQMLANMEDPQSIGPAMAVALLTTLYGAMIANLVAIPIADKLELRSKEERMIKSLVVDGINAMQAGYNPRVVKELLVTYLPNNQRELPEAA